MQDTGQVTWTVAQPHSAVRHGSSVEYPHFKMSNTSAEATSIAGSSRTGTKVFEHLSLDQSESVWGFMLGESRFSAAFHTLACRCAHSTFSLKAAVVGSRDLSFGVEANFCFDVLTSHNSYRTFERSLHLHS